MQVKAVQGLVKKLRRGFRHMSHFGHHSKSAAPVVPILDRDAQPDASPVEPLLIDVVRDFPATPITLPPASPRNKASSESMAMTATSGHSESADQSSTTTGVSESQSSAYTSAKQEVIEEEASQNPASTTPSTHGEVASSMYVFAQDEGEHTPSAKSVTDLPSTIPEQPSSDDLSAEPEANPVVAEHPSPRVGALDSASDTQSAVSQEQDQDANVPPVIVEPEVPDPFLVDDEPRSEPEAESEEGSVPEDAPSGLSADNAEPPLTAADEIALAQSSASLPLTDPLAAAADVHKATPPPPRLESEDEDEDEAPQLYLPGLTLPTMFLPIPNTDPITVLLTKYISPDRRPARDLTGNWQGADFHTLVMTNSWRALARMARDRIVEADPEDLALVLSLWYLRLSCLARLRLFNQTSAECTNLFAVLNAVEPAASRQWLFDKILPFELEVLYAKLKYWAGDHMGYLDALSALLKRCKAKARQAKADAAGAGMWQERGARVCLIIASQLIEMNDLAAAAKLLEPLCKQGDGPTSPYVQSAVGRVYIQGGCIGMAAKHFTAVAEDPTADSSLKAMNKALLASADGDWPRATEVLQEILAADPENYIAINNLSVALLSQGKLQESIQLLEDAIKASPSTTLMAEPLLFNISTMYELHSTAGIDQKRELLIEVAKWAGDGLRTTCLKMPTN
ncbi:hypothetical protein AcW1_006737 [Taiwanofungus camphoratus]|nr:hypothetical protein AcV7_007331 [Antrodia cinnamomea]KAI0955028.1 hypothetical protein AcW1_006737 [Antrodia cinnamomea]